MKKLLIGIGALTAFALSAGTAQAGGSLKDMPIVEAPTWSGFYLGAGVGYGQAVIDTSYWTSDGVTTSYDDGARGGLATFIIGLDRQVHNRFVIGAFVDFDWSDIKFEHHESGLGSNLDAELQIDWSWAIGGRAGYLFTPNTLVYVTGGFTQAHFDNKGWYEHYPDSDAGETGDILYGKDSLTHNGYFVGFGLETLLGHNLALRGEMRYAEYGSEVINTGNSDDGGCNCGNLDFRDEEDPSLLTGRIALTYKFGHGHHRPVAPIK